MTQKQKEKREEEFDRKFKHSQFVDYSAIKSFISQQIKKAQKESLEKIIEIVRNIPPPECQPRENSEWHLGCDWARCHYAEEKFKVIKDLEALKEKLKKEI